MQALILPTINLAILVSVLVYFLRAPMRAFIESRHQTLRRDLAEVRSKLQQAKFRYDEYTAKLKAIGAEVETTTLQAKQDAEALKSRWIASARQSAGLVLSEAKSRAESLVTEFREHLRSELGARIVERAEQVIRERLTGDDRARIRREFSERVGSTQ